VALALREGAAWGPTGRSVQESLRRALGALYEETKHLCLLSAAPELREDAAVKTATRAIMRVLVAGMGHFDARARRNCIRLLSGLTAGHGWDVVGPLPTDVSSVGSNVCLEAVISDSRLQEKGSLGRVRVLLFAPQWSSVEEAQAAPHAIPSLIEPELEPFEDDGEPAVRLRLSLPAFPRPGFYDWRVVLVDPENGQAFPVPTVIAPGPGVPRKWVVCQGRWVVYHKQAPGEVGREVALDEFGLVYDQTTGEIERHGTFQDVERIGAVRERGHRARQRVGRDPVCGRGDPATRGGLLQRRCHGLASAAGGSKPRDF
jgi:hypothetical protein